MKPLRVTIDASSILSPRTGVGQYTFELIRHLLDLDRENRYNVFVNSLRRPFPEKTWFQNREHWKVRHWRLPGPWLHKTWKNWRWPPIEWMAGKSDVVHAPATILPPTGKTPCVATLHDCYFMRRPEHCHDLGGLYLRATLPKRLARCAAVICDSKFTRDEAMEIFHLEEGKTHVVPLGVDTDFFKIEKDSERLEATRKKRNLPNRFFLSVATMEPRKNFEGLLRAYGILREIMTGAPKLVCVGGRGFQNEDYRGLIRELDLEETVFFTGYVERENIPDLYRLAEALVVPSFYEGFGLTVLEAMACGTPVIAGDNPALRETGGEAALYVSPHDVDRIAQAMKTICGNLGEKQRMREAGLENAKKFTWRKTAAKTLAIYEQAGAK